MKKWSRLTALVLAFAIVLSTVSGALAQIEIDHGEFQTWVADTKEAEGLSGVISIDEGGDVLVAPSTFTGELNQGPLYTSESTQNLSAYAQGSAPTVDVALGQYSKVELAAPSAGQWQVYLSAADLWVNITGETGSTFALTYAKVKGMIDADGAAKIRCLMGENATETVNVTVRYEDAAVVVNSTATVSQPMVMSARTVAADAQAEGEVKETYSVIINYVFADGEQAANPWTAKVVAGSPVSQTVVSPAVLGYTPDQASVDINIENIAADTKYTVTYSAALVQYKVRHYQQNLNDNDYTLVTEDIKKGYTDSAVGEDLETTYTGFYALLYDESTEIAADSSTVVEIYYDRYYFLMSFDLDGGYGDDCEPIYARFGAAVSAGTPTKAGYTFAGWKNAESGAVYTVDNFPHQTMPAMNTKFVAQWTAGNTTYDVVFWYENANDDGYSQAGVLQDQAGVAGAVVNGATYQNSNFTGKDGTHFTYSHADENVVLEGDGSTVVNVYFSRNVYTLTFIADGTCGLEEHTHTNCQKICGLTEHEHSCSVCCDASSHVHLFSSPNTNKCPYGYEHSHGASCYSCGKTQHTHTNNCSNSSRQNTVKVISAKYEENISQYFPIVSSNGKTYTGYEWDDTGSTYSYVLQTLDVMPGTNVTFNGSLRGTDCVIYYYVEVVEGESLDGLTTRTFNGKTYKLFKSVEHSFNFITYSEEYHPIEGFSRSRSNADPSFGSDNEANLGSAGNGYDHVNYLYYNRESYILTFSNVGSIVSGKGGTVQYEAPLKKYEFEPDYPSTFEPNAYVFEGWYESPFFGDTKVDFEKATMPASDVTLYARWVPKNHNVNIYLTEDLDTDNKVGATQVVAHRETATNPYPDVNNPPKHPASDLYQFVGWFYMDGETEKAFDFSMPVTQDLDLYAKWSSNTLIEYTIHYAVENKDGTLTYIAEDTTGSGLAGTTKTFPAKAGEELNEGYQSGYFPTTNSHSLTLDIVDLKNNEYTFIYVPKEELPYKVLYLEYDGNDVYDGTEKQLHDPKTDKTRDAIITETFEPVTGYMPDAYQKRLVLSANEAENVIIFWYTKDAVHAPVQIIHYIQNAEGDGNSIYQESTDLNGVIDQSYSTNVLNITGFDYDRATANGVAVEDVNGKVTGTVTENGLILELYYVREVHPYEFQFLEQGTNKELADPVTGVARYGSQVTQNAKTIPGYKRVSEEAQAITIQIEDGATAVKNVRIFYYVEEEVLIQYVAVGPEGVTNFGTVTPTSNTIGAVNGPEPRSLADANDPTYKFVGWFTNPECTIPVNSAWLSGTVENDQQVIKPQKQDHDNDAATAAIYVGAIYYAKFEYNVGKLKVTKQASAQTTNDTVPENAEFTFTLSGVEWDSVKYPYTVYNKGENADTVASSGELTSSNKTFTLKNEQYVIIENLLHGANATVTETNSDEYYTTWDPTKVANLTADDSLSGTTTIQAGNNPVELTCYNVYRAQVGNLTINKTLQDSTFTADSLEKLQLTFTVMTDKDLSKWSINPADALVNTANKTITYVMTLENGAHSGEVTFQNLPIGDYTVTESAIALTKDGTALTYKTYTKSIADDGAAVKVEKGKTAKVEVINTASGTIAELPVTKAWVDNEYVKYRSAVTMHLSATVEDDTTPVYTDIVLDGIVDDVEAEAWTGKWKNLPMFDTKGNEIIYTVSEVAAPVHYSMTSIEGDNSGWTVTNTINVGKLVITKSGMLPDESAIFVVNIGDKIHHVVLSGVDDRGTAVSAVIGQIPDGSSYSVVEDGDWTKFYDQTNKDNESGTIDAGEMEVASFDNKKDDQWLHDEDFKKNVFGNK